MQAVFQISPQPFSLAARWHLSNKTLAGPAEEIALVESIGENLVDHSRLHFCEQQHAQSAMLAGVSKYLGWSAGE